MQTTSVIDIDPELLRRSAAAQVHAFTQAWDHISKESTGHVPTILDTLIPNGPWAWAIVPELQPDGSISMPVQTTHEGIEEMYRMIRGASDVLSAEATIDVQGSWYSFLEVYARSRIKATGEERGMEMVLVLPVNDGPGITGELAWTKLDRAFLGKDLTVAPPRESGEMRRFLLALHEDYLDAMRTHDAAGMAAVFSPSCYSAVRDYVDDTGTLAALDDLAGLEGHYRAFFDRFEVRSVDVLHRVVQDWYVFAEVRVEVTVRSGADAGEDLAFHTASLFAPGKEDKFIVQIGHGTDLAPCPA
jgi:hypothetical protein